MKTVAIGLSGGVDSTLAALLLKEQGYRVIGLTMSIYNKDIPNLKPTGNACYGPTEKSDLPAIHAWAESQGFEHHTFDLSEPYKKTVLNYFKETYLAGKTPNPCVVCNTRMKFGLLADVARENGVRFDYFATGHYVRLTERDERFALQKGVDPIKDQSYFLYRLTQEQLATTLFPLGGYTKEEVRHMARERGIPVADKTDSQDFYAGDYADLLQQPPKEGPIMLLDGTILGKHQGFWNYTIGQRKGLGIAYPEPLYVIDIDAAHNRVIVGTVSETLMTSCVAEDIVWGALPNLTKPLKADVKYRSAGKTVPATLIPDGDTVHVQLDAPQKALTRGQSIVFYQDDIVLGGGMIR